MYYDKWCSIDALLGQTLKDVHCGVDEIIFTTVDDVRYKMYHCQDCCESVYIEDIVGDLADLIGSPILRAEESNDENLFDIIRNSGEDTSHRDESFTWTFYKLATFKGYVDIRWYGSSNGYYSEGVDFVRLPSDT